MKMPDESEIARHTPMRTMQYMIAVVLAEHDAHGYGIMKEIARLSGGSVSPGPATVHRLLSKLVAEGLAEESPERPARMLDDERRRYFRLTRLGLSTVKAETERRFAFVSDVRTRLSEDA
jgi:DNA-binding PadR family transcriptional regulator